MDKTQVVLYDRFNYDDQELEDDDDALSLCNLPLGNDEENDVVSNKNCNVDDDGIDSDAFEFSTTKSSLVYSHTSPTVVFCGKSIPCRSNSKPISATLPQTTSSQTPHATSSISDDPMFSWPRSSLSLRNKAQSSRFHNVRTATTTRVPPRSSSLRVPETGKSRYQQYYSSSSSSRSCSRKHNVLIGVLTKFPPRMELSEMRKRQSRRAPVPMLSAAYGGDQPVVAGSESRGRGHWGLLRFRSNLVSALARVSFGCTRHV